jgi:quinol monooxygenase YgiN
MTTISKTANLVTFINVFKVKPEDQDRLVELLSRVTNQSVRHAAGFISATLHRSNDGTRVTMYAQWTSLEDYEAMRRGAGSAAELREAMTLATFEPGQYEVVESFSPRDQSQ